MNKAETVQVITLLAGNYNSIAEKDSIQKELMLKTWQECLGDLDYKLVLQAVKKAMILSPYPPTIHDIRTNVASFMSKEQKTGIEAWDEAYRMICNGLYMTEEQFESSSDEVKRFFGNIRQVRELAQTDIDVVNTVTKGQFLKQYDVLVQRTNESRMLPNSMNELTKRLAESMDINKLGE